MVKKVRKLRTFARTASKSMEKKIVDNTKKVMVDPYILLPYYEDSYSSKYFGKIKKKFDKINKFKNDTKKLEKLSNKKDISGALAGALLIAHSEKAPYLGVLKYKTGDITYAQRGRSDKEKQAGIQHYDNPVLRLLCFKELALKKNIHLYSWDDGFVSTGLKPNPPQGFIKFILDQIDLDISGDIKTCKHLKPEKVKEEKNLDEDYLRIYWKSANTIIGFCKNCSKSKKNTLFDISKYIIESDVSKDFDIKVIGRAIKDTFSNEQNTINIKEYLSGEISDYDFIKKNMLERHKVIKESNEKLFVLDGKNYGDNFYDFINDLKPNEYERKGLEVILKKIDEPVIFENTTPNKVLEKYWKNKGLDVIKEIINDDKMAENFFLLDDSPSEIIKLVFKYIERQKILSRLPKYDSLPPLAKFVDNVTRTYKTYGKKKAIGEIRKRPDTTKGKSIAYAFLLTFGKGEDKKWQFSNIEIEFGESLADKVKKLLNSKPEEYHKYIQDILKFSGSSEKI